MVTRDGWTEQIKLAKNKNVRIESGGITWLFNEEFYPYPSAVRAIKEAADMIKSCGKFNISVLSNEADFDLIKQFGFVSGKETDKFTGYSDIKRSENGLDDSRTGRP